MKSHGQSRSRVRFAAAVVAAVLVWGGAGAPPAGVRAQAESSEDPGESRSTSFRAVSGPQTEDVPGGALLIGAYAVVWVLLLGFVVRLGVLQGRTRRELEQLERRLGESGAGPPPE